MFQVENVKLMIEVNVDDHSSKSPNEASGEQTNFQDSQNVDLTNDLNQEAINTDYQNSPLNYTEFIDENHMNNYKSMIIKSDSDESNDDEMF